MLAQTGRVRCYHIKPAKTYSETVVSKQSLFLVLLLIFTGNAAAQQRVDVAVVNDGISDRLAFREQKYIDELLTLTSAEFDVRIHRFAGDWTRASISAAIDRAYADDRIDMLLVTGFVANQLATTRREFPKPTFLPIVLHTGLLAQAAEGDRSGIGNLNYLSAYANFADDLEVFSRMVPYTRLVILVDDVLSSAIEQLRLDAFAASEERGIDLIEVTHDGLDHAILDRIPADTDAIFVSGLPRMPAADFDRLIESINAAGLPSYSFVGVPDVERGLLMTDFEPRDLDRQARLNALNMQAVMLGERPEDQPITSGQRRRVTINMATARRIGLSPSFDLLSSATLLNQEAEATGREYGLIDVANEAVDRNQDLLAETYGTQAGEQEIGRARSSLLPQLGAGAGLTTRKITPQVEAGLFPERTADATFNLDQLIYSDAATANLRIQKELQLTRTESLRAFQLDVIQAATTSYYTVLNARSQLGVAQNNLRVSRANLELARDRVNLGTSTPADIYRWEAEVARGQILVLNAETFVDRSWHTLNRILHLPQDRRLLLKDASFNEPFVISREEFDSLVRSPADYRRFSQYLVDRGMRRSPELSQLDPRIAAKQRELVSQQRSYWLPDFSVGGQFSSNIDQAGAGVGPITGEGLNNWTIGVQATLPLFTGGLRRANVSRASYELQELESLRISIAERVEEQIRNEIHLARSAYGAIDLTAAAAEATRKNFELVSDAYARGTVSIIELLDAQDASLAATAASVDSLYTFLIQVMAMQRAVGGFDYLLPMDERLAMADELREYLTR